VDPALCRNSILFSGLQLCIATYSDERYSRGSKLVKPIFKLLIASFRGTVAGKELVQKVLRGALSEEQAAKVTIISMNPGSL